MAARFPQLSRARLRALITEGALSQNGSPLTDASAKVRAGTTYLIRVPAPTPADPQPEAIPLAVLYQDPDLIVIDKPAGMAVHPAPGSPSGTLPA